MYKLSKELINGLKAENINYCHWKSNLLLNEALNGYDDLDLLVKKSHISKFESLLYKLGFKRASNKNLEIQSVHHFYGYDIDTGEILHLHVYYQIKTGPSWTKSLRFDFEDYILDNLVEHKSGMLIPEKHIEIVIFIIRIMMKYTKINEYILVRKESERTIREIEYLLEDMDKEKMNSFLSDYFPKISPDSFFNYIKVIQDGSFTKKFTQARKLKRSVKRYLYQGFFINAYKNVNQFIYRVFNKIFYKQKKNLFSGGSSIVIAGLDATGKTTITTELKKWLGKNFTISEVHFGKPSSTFLTLPINLMIKLLRKRTPIEGELRSSIKNESKQKSFLFIIRQLVLAYDRFVLANKIWKKTSKGSIVLCDRYKSENFGVMDSKRLETNNCEGLKKKMSLKENQLYDSMPVPDILFYLTVPVDVAVRRNADRIKKGKESEEFLRIRHLQNQDLSYKAKNSYRINTDREYKEVIKEIKTIIWKNI